jgi:hypothetical protein
VSKADGLELHHEAARHNAIQTEWLWQVAETILHHQTHNGIEIGRLDTLRHIEHMLDLVKEVIRAQGTNGQVLHPHIAKGLVGGP